MPKYLLCDFKKNGLIPKAIVIAQTPASAFSAYLKTYNLKRHNGMIVLHLQRTYAMQKLNMTIQAKYNPKLPTIFSDGFKKMIIKLREKIPHLGYNDLSTK